MGSGTHMGFRDSTDTTDKTVLGTREKIIDANDIIVVFIARGSIDSLRLSSWVEDSFHVRFQGR